MALDLSHVPKTETHLHIEGAIRPDTYVELRRRQEPSYSIEQSPWRDRNYRFDSLAHFLDTASPSVLASAEDYRRIARELFEDLLAQNVIYSEISIASHRVAIGEIAQAIHDAWKEVVPDGRLDFGILVGLFRGDGPETVLQMVRQAIDAMSFGVVGVDLLAHETANKASALQHAYLLARDAGLGLRAHAGEGAGPESVWDAIRSLGVSRIAHGVRAIEAPELVTHLVEQGVCLDMCPTSNYRLKVVDALEEHPIRRFFEAGVKVTVSSDDPLFFGSDVSAELALVQDMFGFTGGQLRQLAANAIDAGFISQDRKDALQTKLTEGYNTSMQATPE